VFEGGPDLGTKQAHQPKAELSHGFNYAPEAQNYLQTGRTEFCVSFERFARNDGSEALDFMHMTGAL